MASWQQEGEPFEGRLEGLNGRQAALLEELRPQHGAGEQVRGEEQGVGLARVGCGAFGDIVGVGLRRARGSHPSSARRRRRTLRRRRARRTACRLQRRGPPPFCRVQDAAGGWLQR
ncbi:hypothetical protein [Streptomyces sp. CB02959]|uniref:hypothetical protein n=1 Tax=Streptomyces sp. CB02959 TaxID=2020330 RepID=UPI001C609BAE|nr:hypothetical protein [Streptomyces sp. CB02959]